MINYDKKRIQVKNLSKSFKADFNSRLGALLTIINFLTFKKEKRQIVIADNLSFDVYSGQVLGIIGKNGAGKSSLLRVIAGIYKQDKGHVVSTGKVVYLSGMGHGMIHKLTMRENIFLMGSIMGLRQKDIRKKFDDIVKFSGLEDYVDMRIYQFSTGMISRLIFSVSLYCIDHHSPDILLVDEVLSAGGDADFQYKATKKMDELIRSGAAVIMVSHDMESVKKYCDRVLFLDKGLIQCDGDPNTVVNYYLESINDLD